jgi:hypothetical protein
MNEWQYAQLQNKLPGLIFKPISTRNYESRKAEEMERALLAFRNAYLTS